jgi:hypothetical protein
MQCVCAILSSVTWPALQYFSLNIILNCVGQHNHFITQVNYKATCFDYRLVILRSILSIVSQDAMHTLGSHRVYIQGMLQIKSFVSKGVTYNLFPTFSHKRHDFRKKKVFEENNMFEFVNNFVWNILILTRTERDNITTVYRSSCQVAFILARF